MSELVRIPEDWFPRVMAHFDLGKVANSEITFDKRYNLYFCLQQITKLAMDVGVGRAYGQRCQNLISCALNYNAFLSPIRMRRKYTRVNILRCAIFTRSKQIAHANANTHRSKVTYR